MAVTYSSLTTDTEAGQQVFLRHALFKLRLTEESSAFMHVFQISLATEKLNYISCCLFDCTSPQPTLYDSGKIKCEPLGGL